MLYSFQYFCNLPQPTSSILPHTTRSSTFVMLKTFFEGFKSFTLRKKKSKTEVAKRALNHLENIHVQISVSLISFVVIFLCFCTFLIRLTPVELHIHIQPLSHIQNQIRIILFFVSPQHQKKNNTPTLLSWTVIVKNQQKKMKQMKTKI